MNNENFVLNEQFNLFDTENNQSKQLSIDELINCDYSQLDKDLLEKANKLVTERISNFKGNEIEKDIHNKMINSCMLGDPNAKKCIKEKIKKIIVQDLKLCTEPKLVNLYTKKIFEDNYGLSCIEDLINDSRINEIIVDGYDNIRIDIVNIGKLRTERKFKDNNDIIRVMNNMLQSDNKSINASTPICESKTKNEERLTFSIPPVAKVPYMNIRKFDSFECSSESLLEKKTVNEEMVHWFERIVKGRPNMLVIGATGSGKTTFVKWLSEFIPSDLRIGTIEKGFELRLDEKYGRQRDIFSYETHEEIGITMTDIFYLCLRNFPDIILVGEARGSGEGKELVKSWLRGHPGSIGTFHTNTYETTIPDFADMINEDGRTRDLVDLKYRISTALNFIIEIRKFKKDNKKIVTNITEVIPNPNTKDYTLNPIFKFNIDRNYPNDWEKGYFEKVGNISEYTKQRLNLYGLSYLDMENL